MANWPSRVDYKLPDHAAAEIDFFVNNTKNLSKIIDSVNKQTPKMTLQDVVEAISKETKIEAGDVRIIVNTFENIQILSEDLGSIDEGINRLHLAVNKEISDKLLANKASIEEIWKRQRCYYHA